MERYDITIQMLGVEASGPQYVWEKVPAEEGELVLYTDAQATIAALEETILKMGENAAVVAKDAMAAKEQVAALQARVKECDAVIEKQVAILEEINKLDAERAAFVVDLKAQLTQRTAELEAANKHWDALWNAACEQKDTLQAELERVRGQYAELGKMVLALPKVEGEIEVSSGVYNFILLKHDSGTRFLCGQIETEQTAKAYAALLQHRQGMEG